jgi:hypothetical protein
MNMSEKVMTSQLQITPMSRDPQKILDVIADLKTRMAAETRERGTIGRLTWLFSHVDEFLGRWVACVTQFLTTDFIHHDFHVVLTIAVGLVDEEAAQLANANLFKECWREFASVFRNITSIDKSNAGPLAQELMARFELVRNSLPKIENQ